MLYTHCQTCFSSVCTHPHWYKGSRIRGFTASTEHNSEQVASNSYIYTSLSSFSSRYFRKLFPSNFCVDCESYLSYWLTNIQGSCCVILSCGVNLVLRQILIQISHSIVWLCYSLDDRSCGFKYREKQRFIWGPSQRLDPPWAPHCLLSSGR